MDQLILLFHLLLVDPMTNVLVALARLFGGNFGLAIIVFTLVMKFVTWPLTASQYKQSRAMQAIQPQMQELQKKYKGKDPKKLQAETMALYREAGVNPVGCVIPMLVQFPIWIALYQVIRLSLGDTPESLVTLSGRLYPIPFIHQAVPLNNGLLYWNLGQPDTSYVLPFIVAASMYIQQKLITPTPTAATAQSQQQQQTAQMMTWMMPLMFGFWSLTVPAGLALYWAVSNASGIVLQYFYMGRKFQWKSLLQFGPPAPAAGAAAKKSERTKPAPEPAAEDVQVDEGGEATLSRPQNTRRNKHGRRRGKR
jgi:YidC/Oxa1 family membrane protein insertase